MMRDRGVPRHGFLHLPAIDVAVQGFRIATIDARPCSRPDPRLPCPPRQSFNRTLGAHVFEACAAAEKYCVTTPSSAMSEHRLARTRMPPSMLSPSARDSSALESDRK